VFCAFDLLAHDGRSLIAEPLERRKHALKALLDCKPGSVMYVGHFEAKHGKSL
jgi:ATP-dependent DNA ligase